MKEFDEILRNDRVDMSVLAVNLGYLEGFPFWNSKDT